MMTAVASLMAHVCSYSAQPFHNTRNCTVEQMTTVPAVLSYFQECWFTLLMSHNLH